VLPVKEVVVVGLVETFEYSPAYLRHDADPDVLVLQVDHLVGLVHFFVSESVVQGIGIDPAFGALRSAAEVEHGVLFGRAGQVGRDGHISFPDLHCRSVGAE
jgi:hypothetical protein